MAAKNLLEAIRALEAKALAALKVEEARAASISCVETPAPDTMQRHAYEQEQRMLAGFLNGYPVPVPAVTQAPPAPANPFYPEAK